MRHFLQLFPGLLLAFGIAGASVFVALTPALQKWGISSAIIAIIAGIFIGNTLYRYGAKTCAAGIDFSKQRILRIAIIFFGLRLTFQDIIEIGTVAILIDAVIILSTFALTLYLGQKLLRVDRQTSILIGSGCSICGAAAILATSSMLSPDEKEGSIAPKVSVAVSTIVIFGTIAMLIYPIIYRLLANSWGIGEAAFGIYIGSTIHEVAQVAGAGASINDAVANGAVITKMIRVLMLAPFLLLLSVWQAKQSNATSGGKAPIVIPWFAIAFILMAGIASTGWIPESIKLQLIWLDNLFLTAAMAALGIGTHYRVFRQAGYKPMLLAALIFIWLLLGGALINFLFLSLYTL